MMDHEEEEKQDIVHPLSPTHVYQHINADDPSEHDHLTASLVSLDSAVQRTRRRTHLGALLAPGGDYDESQISPQLMAYLTRLAIYENDHAKPQAVDHTDSTFKKYSDSTANRHH